ncbi:tRNA-dihydrouridine synthase [Phascolarctobacterium succinatutens CAG:287]|uniref:tRNA-dihydrouridine synthase n=1 Tax=Phascolarctobacterium succinatutens CAG:287 TaxID=1263101 RepID=R6WKI2_9FIRM|nr:tRNA dihydrouridine synthase DusB [Phascolarctobacterium succinatutens]CDD11658.1 tRNA-dihydrouridine synthase [Phascolarctobacterium succinatutens CAG:287]
MNIGNIELSAPLALAPMAGITDLPFRLICRRLGCGMTVSEMVSAKGLLYKNVKTTEMLRIDDGERPTAIQLFGNVPAELAEAARMVEASGADMIDFNMGCPVPKIVNNGEGSALMKNPQLAHDILAAMVKAVKIPVTVKFRAGWDDNNRNAVEIARAVEAAGVSAVAVHGRTRQQFYEGKADWSIIADVKQAVKVPVFGNGDIFTVADGLRMLEQTGCDGLMIGRGADGNPWLFTALAAALRGEQLPQPPSLKERLAQAAEHLEMLIAYKNEVVAVKEMRRHISAYLKGMPHAAEFRGRFHKVDTQEQFSELLAEYSECAHHYYETEKHFASGIV